MNFGDYLLVVLLLGGYAIALVQGQSESEGITARFSFSV